MPLKDKVLKKAYDLEWRRKHPTTVKAYNDNWRSNRKATDLAEIKKLFDLKCVICGAHDKDSTYGVSFHKKDGGKHTHDRISKIS